MPNTAMLRGLSIMVKFLLIISKPCFSKDTLVLGSCAQGALLCRSGAHWRTLRVHFFPWRALFDQEARHDLGPGFSLPIPALGLSFWVVPKNKHDHYPGMNSRYTGPCSKHAQPHPKRFKPILASNSICYQDFFPGLSQGFLSKLWVGDARPKDIFLPSKHQSSYRQFYSQPSVFPGLGSGWRWAFLVSLLNVLEKHQTDHSLIPHQWLGSW